jgi:hypothetical protein
MAPALPQAADNRLLAQAADDLRPQAADNRLLAQAADNRRGG